MSCDCNRECTGWKSENNNGDHIPVKSSMCAHQSCVLSFPLHVAGMHMRVTVKNVNGVDGTLK